MKFSEEYKKAKQFVKEHKTVFACAASAVTAVVITREFDAIVARKFAFSQGFEAGNIMSRMDYLQKDWDDAFQYLKENELMNDFADWAGWTVVTQEIHDKHFPLPGAK